MRKLWLQKSFVLWFIVFWTCCFLITLLQLLPLNVYWHVPRLWRPRSVCYNDCVRELMPSVGPLSIRFLHRGLVFITTRGWIEIFLMLRVLESLPLCLKEFVSVWLVLLNTSVSGNASSLFSLRFIPSLRTRFRVCSGCLALFLI